MPEAVNPLIPSGYDMGWWLVAGRRAAARSLT